MLFVSALPAMSIKLTWSPTNGVAGKFIEPEAELVSTNFLSLEATVSTVEPSNVIVAHGLPPPKPGIFKNKSLRAFIFG